MSNKVQRRIIIMALEEPDKLSDWENEFINYIADKDDEYKLTDKQNSILNRISQKLI